MSKREGKLRWRKGVTGKPYSIPHWKGIYYLLSPRCWQRIIYVNKVGCCFGTIYTYSANWKAEIYVKDHHLTLKVFNRRYEAKRWVEGNCNYVN